jgi:hypothetical protein
MVVDLRGAGSDPQPHEASECSEEPKRDLDDFPCPLLRADAYLSTQPQDRNVERAQFGHSGGPEGTQVLTAQAGIGSSGRIRTYNPPVNSRMLYP